MSTVLPPVSTAQALGMLEAALGYLATADATAMAAEEQARCLKVLERLHATETAARSSVLGTFTIAQGYSTDGAYSPRAWLIHQSSRSGLLTVSYLE